MNDNANIPNPELASFVSQFSFVLTLRKTQITALITLANDADCYTRWAMLRDFVTPMRALAARGLVKWSKEPFGPSRRDPRITDHYRLTRAGWAVYDLLVEAGMAPAIERRDSKRRLVA
jgi:hypothetical protein